MVVKKYWSGLTPPRRQRNRTTPRAHRTPERTAVLCNFESLLSSVKIYVLKAKTRNLSAAADS